MKGKLRVFRTVHATLAGTLIALSPALLALSPPPPQPDDELLPLLYETLGGDNWRNNDGWLNPEVHWCDWHGVECGEEYFPGFYDFTALELPDNNLRGEMTEELAELLFINMAPESSLDLSGNTISGEMYFYPRLTPAVDLSDNVFSGPLPPFEGDWVLDGQRAPRLFLQRNEFSGEIPPSWSDLRLTVLDLSDNHLESGHQHAIDAISPPGTGFVYLNGNPLEGELTRDVLTAPVTPRGESNIGGGIDICFTKLTVDDPDVRQWIADRHVASADFEQCLDRERSAVDATLSGSWYHPDRPGEGASIMMLDNGAPLLYTFSFDTQGNQQWLVKVGHSGDRFVNFEGLQETRGSFGQGVRQEFDYTFIRPTADFRFDRIDPNLVSLHRHYYDRRACGPWEYSGVVTLPCPPPLLADRLDYHRLTQQAGTTCDNQSGFQHYSGAWYNPEHSGEGFVIEVLPDDRAIVYWFTYTPDGSGDQAWMIGQGVVGSFDALVDDSPPTGPPESRIEIDTVLQPVGTAFGPDFDAADIELVDWGSLIVDFYRDGSARVTWDSKLEGYGEGSEPIDRLASPRLADCSND